MKSFIEISFPLYPKKQKILIKEALKINTDSLSFMLDVNKEENDKEIELAKHKSHIIEGLKLVSFNHNVYNEEHRYQEVIFSGYYRRENEKTLTPCDIIYKIYGRDDI